MSISTFIRSIFSNDLYIQIWENRLKITALHSTEVYDEIPLLAIKDDAKGRPIVQAIGNSVKSMSEKDGYKIINPFSHPRVLISDFQVAEKVLQHAFKLIHQSKYFTPSPRVVIQPMEKLEGGITGIEERAYRELCLSAGARVVYIHTGAPLSVHNLDFEKLQNESS